MHASHQMNGFNDRIARIQDPRFKHVIDPESGMKIPRRVTRDEIANVDTTPSSMIGMALVLGMLCLMVARYVRLEVLTAQPYFPEGLITELSMAAMGAIIIGGLVGMRTTKKVMWQMVGIAIATVSMHNAVWLAPDQFALVFSQSYVDQILAQTDPMSLYVNGTSFALKV